MMDEQITLKEMAYTLLAGVCLFVLFYGFYITLFLVSELIN